MFDLECLVRAAEVAAGQRKKEIVRSIEAAENAASTAHVLRIIECKAKLEIASLKDENGKPLYGNEDARTAQLCVHLAEREGYVADRSDMESLEYQAEKHKAEAEHNRDLVRIYTAALGVLAGKE